MNAPQPAPLALPNYSALDLFVTPAVHNGDDLRAALEDAGWAEIGEGCYCSAYLSPDGSRVLKVGSGTGARATIETAMSHSDNPHLPKIYGLLDLGDYEFAVECEPLEHFDDFDPDADEFNYSDTWRSWKDEYLGPDRYRGPDLNDAPDGPMKDALAALVEAQQNSGARWDCHDGNVMVRPSDGALVLNDLLA